jgi:hypothetical protein
MQVGIRKTTNPLPPITPGDKLIVVKEPLDNGFRGLLTEVDGVREEFISTEGGESIRYTHTQIIPAAQWVVQHNKNARFAAYSARDSSGGMIEGTINTTLATNNVFVIDWDGVALSGEIDILF